MKYRVFTYPVPCDEAVAELNGFLSSHRILRVRDEIVLKGNDPYWRFTGISSFRKGKRGILVGTDCRAVRAYVRPA